MMREECFVKTTWKHLPLKMVSKSDIIRHPSSICKIVDVKA